MKANICLSILTRKYCNKIVDVPDDFETWSSYKKTKFMSELFIQTVDNGYDSEWQDDYDWGCEEGEHHVFNIIKD